MTSGPSSSPGSAVIVPFTTISMRRGPIPDAAELAGYADAHPDAPRRILDEFQRQGEHRRNLELGEQRLKTAALRGMIVSERMGMLCALVIALTGFACAVALVVSGHGAEGTVIFGMDVAGMVSAFIMGRNRSAARD